MLKISFLLIFICSKFKEILHYRLLDVTSWKIPFWVRGIEMKKKNNHRALDDIKESIKEFGVYLNFVDFERDVEFEKE